MEFVGEWAEVWVSGCLSGRWGKGWVGTDGQVREWVDEGVQGSVGDGG